MKTSKIISAALIVGSLVLSPVSVWAQQQSKPFVHGYGSHMMGWGEGGSGMIFGPVFMILLLVVVIAVVVLMVRWLGGPSLHAHPPQHAPLGRTALDILKERYARGEIDKEEFEERRRVLGD